MKNMKISSSTMKPPLASNAVIATAGGEARQIKTELNKDMKVVVPSGYETLPAINHVFNVDPALDQTLKLSSTHKKRSQKPPSKNGDSRNSTQQ